MQSTDLSYYLVLFSSRKQLSDFAFKSVLFLKTKLERSAYAKSGKWAVMYLCVNGIVFAYFYGYDVWLWNCSDNVGFLFFNLLLQQWYVTPATLFCSKSEHLYVHTCIRHCNVTYRSIDRPAGVNFHYLCVYNVRFILLLLFINYIPTI